MLVDFCNVDSVSSKSFALKEKQHQLQQYQYQLQLDFYPEKLSIMSFMYELLETLCFPDEKVKKITENAR